MILQVTGALQRRGGMGRRKRIGRLNLSRPQRRRLVRFIGIKPILFLVLLYALCSPTYNMILLIKKSPSMKQDARIFLFICVSNGQFWHILKECGALFFICMRACVIIFPTKIQLISAFENPPNHPMSRTHFLLIYFRPNNWYQSNNYMSQGF